MLIDLDRVRNAIGIGRKSAQSGEVSMGLHLNMAGKRIRNVPEPASPADAATKKYVDGKSTRMAVTLAPDTATLAYGFYGIGFMASATTLRINIPLSVPFPGRPSVSITGKLQVILLDGSSSQKKANVSRVSIHGYYGDFITLDVVCESALTANMAGALTRANDNTASINFTMIGGMDLGDDDYDLVGWSIGESEDNG